MEKKPGTQHRLFLSVGHDEYWSGRQRRNVEAARAAGVHLAFFSGNEVYWKIRWEPSIDPAGDASRVEVEIRHRGPLVVRSGSYNFV